MEIIILVATIITLAEVSYLIYRSSNGPKVVRDSILLDTNILIDGRILPIARSGLITSPLIVPNSVTRELQFMADKADHDKRERARFGLDMIDKLKQIDGIEVRVVDDGATSKEGVDEQLMILAERWQARLCTIDYNLNKSARVHNIQVININELAQALRVTYLPGEELEVALVQAGQEPRQGVGYLDDGTMVVVDDAKPQIGQTLTVTATRILQTAAGKMMFAKKVGAADQSKSVKQNGQASQLKRNQKSHHPSVRNNKQRPDNRSSRSAKPRHSDKESELVALANSQSSVDKS